MITEQHLLTENFKAVQKASKALVLFNKEQVNRLLIGLSEAAIAHSEEIIRENQPKHRTRNPS